MNAPLAPNLATTLDDKYTVEQGPVFMTGIQALVRLPIEQIRRDRAAGHKTAGYISGYQGSPLAAIDGALRRAQSHLASHDIVFRPGVNEELAATTVWGTQYVGMFPGAQYEGVFGLWYGKGPGVDRATDALRHSNWAGTSPLGGALALAGDDHGAKSSTVACFSDGIFESMGMPEFYPASVQEILEFGLHGIALSRFASLWGGMKLVTDIVESAGTVTLGPDHPQIVIPTDYEMPEGGLSIRPQEMALIAQEERIFHKRMNAAMAYLRANRVNRIVHDVPGARIGIVSAGKAWQDVRQALISLGIDDARAQALGIRTLKMGVVWPLEPTIVRRFAEGLDTIIVVEEKRPVIETQLRAILYSPKGGARIIGKVREGNLFDPQPSWVFPNFGELKPSQVARVIAEVLAPTDASFAQWSPPLLAVDPKGAAAVPRTPSFCSGCPHNRSTKLPAGSRTLAGIGCHGMQLFLDPENCKTVAQMGGEGMHWLGQQPFTSEKHVFANIGDGTFAHSGSLAIRQAVAAGVPITYKVLVNGFVSMTGGQTIMGGQSVAGIVDTLRADGVQRIVVVTDDVGKYAGVRFPEGVPVFDRAEMDRLQRELREYPGVSAIVYEQPCATERRRLRKQGKWEDPAKRSFINSAVCEGCGDCGKVSTCLSIEPLETELGRKRRINQSSCNKDFSCVEGFCPSFVTVHGGTLRRPDRSAGRTLEPFEVPAPVLPVLGDQAFNVLVGGIGGTGVVTVGQVLAMASHLDGTACLSLDVMGMAQKYGAVLSHLHFAARAEALGTPRVNAGELDTLIGCDLIVASGDEAVSTLARGRSRAVVCSDLIATAEFARNADWTANADALIERIRTGTAGATTLVDGQRMATALLGDAIASNMMMVGAAWQAGGLPLSLEAIDRAIGLNGVQVEMNRKAFAWGRCLAHDTARVERLVGGAQVIEFHRKPAALPLDELLSRRREALRDYAGNDRLAQRFDALVAQVRAVDSDPARKQALTRAVAESWFKLLAVKDEWEVARLYCAEAFRKELESTFEGNYTLQFHVGAWPFARKDPVTGRVQKRALGPWLLRAFGLMSRLRGLRGRWVDPFRHSAERALEHSLREQFQSDVGAVLPALAAQRYDDAVALAGLYARVRGYGHVKEASAQQMRAQREALLTAGPVVQELRRAG